MPENPFLLVAVADIAAKATRHRSGGRRARATHFGTSSMPNVRLIFHRRHGRRVRDGLRATALFVQGRVAAVRGQYKDAEQSLLASLTLNPDDMEALYTIGVVRMAVGADEGAARAFAHVARAGGPLESAAARLASGAVRAQAPAMPERASTRGVQGSRGTRPRRRAGDPHARAGTLRGLAGVPRMPRACVLRRGSRRAWRGCSEPTGPPT